jgi:Putative nuclease YbcO
MLDAARGQSCTIESVRCIGGTDTTVACHSNLQMHGRGHGHRSHDIFVAFGCQACHDWLDYGKAPREVKEAFFHRAMARTLVRMWRMGVLRAA